MERAVDDALQVAGPWRARIDPVVDVHPGVRRSVFGVHGHAVPAVAPRHTFGAVQRGQIVVGHVPDDAVHLRPVERLDGRHPALVDQPVVVGEHGSARIARVGAPLRHLPHAQVGPVREVGMTAPLRHEVMLAERSNCSRRPSMPGLAVGADRQPDQHDVEQTDQRADHPAHAGGDAVIGVGSHQRPIAGQSNQRNERERDTERQNDLRQH